MDRKQYPDEFKGEAVRLAKERGNLAQVARDLGIHDTLPDALARRTSVGRSAWKPAPSALFLATATRVTRRWPNSNGN